MKEREPSSLKASCRINSQQEAGTAATTLLQKVLRQEKQVLHTPREQVKQKGFPAGSVKIFIKIDLFDFKMKLIMV